MSWSMLYNWECCKAGKVDSVLRKTYRHALSLVFNKVMSDKYNVHLQLTLVSFKFVPAKHMYFTDSFYITVVHLPILPSLESDCSIANLSSVQKDILRFLRETDLVLRSFVLCMVSINSEHSASKDREQ